MDLVSILGMAVGMLIGNPLNLIAGLIVSRLAISSIRFWLELLIAIIGSASAMILFDRLLTDVPSRFSPGLWAGVTTLSVLISTCIFKFLRALNQLFSPSAGPDPRQEDWRGGWSCPACGNQRALVSGSDPKGEIVFCSGCEMLWRSVNDATDVRKSVRQSADVITVERDGRMITLREYQSGHPS